jgi:hypothetical protein
MKVKELIKQLKAYPPDAEIRMLSDQEGNNVHGFGWIETYDDIGEKIALVPDDNYYDEEDME